jgi:hypothetical protein
MVLTFVFAGIALFGINSFIPGNVKDQPKQLSSISRNTVRHQPNT